MTAWHLDPEAIRRYVEGTVGPGAGVVVEVDGVETSDHIGVADELRCDAVLHHRPLFSGERLAVVRIGVRRGAAACPNRIHPVAVTGREVLRGGGVVGDYHVRRDHYVRLG